MADIEDMKKSELLKLAAKLGIKIAKAANKETIKTAIRLAQAAKEDEAAHEEEADAIGEGVKAADDESALEPVVRASGPSPKGPVAIPGAWDERESGDKKYLVSHVHHGLLRVWAKDEDDAWELYKKAKGILSSKIRPDIRGG